MFFFVVVKQRPLCAHIPHALPPQKHTTCCCVHKTLEANITKYNQNQNMVKQFFYEVELYDKQHFIMLCSPTVNSLWKYPHS